MFQRSQNNFLKFIPNAEKNKEELLNLQHSLFNKMVWQQSAAFQEPLNT